jgi:N-acetylglucosamine malate deacetylase 1
MKYLFIEPHCDDLALCCGGTIAKVKEAGHDVAVLCLSQNYQIGNLKHEWVEAMEVFGLKNICIKNFKVREFATQRQRILQLFCNLALNKYDYVFVTSPYDFNQDHKVAGEEAVRAFKHTNLITYTAEWNQRTQTKNYFVDLEKQHIKKKWLAIKRFESQKNRPYMTKEVTESILRVNGLISGKGLFAEAFHAINLIQ